MPLEFLQRALPRGGLPPTSLFEPSAPPIQPRHRTPAVGRSGLATLLSPRRVNAQGERVATYGSLRRQPEQRPQLCRCHFAAKLLAERQVKLVRVALGQFTQRRPTTQRRVGLT